MNCNNKAIKFLPHPADIRLQVTAATKETVQIGAGRDELYSKELYATIPSGTGKGAG